MSDVADAVAKFKAENARLEREFNSLVEPHLTDLGNAKRFVLRYGDDIRYVPQWGWLAWTGQRWKRDANAEIWRHAKETILNLHHQASYVEDDGKRRELIQHALRSESEARIGAMIVLTQSESKVIARPEDFDRDPFLFNVQNGMLDLVTGKLQAHRKEDLITKVSPVTHDPAADCPRWGKFLMEIFGENVSLINFIHRAVGYSLSGLTREQCLFLLYGSGANGKSTFLEILKSLLGEYAATADFSTFLIKAQDGIRNDLAGLAGKRFVASVEIEEGRKLAESLIKQITGTDTIAARFLHREFFEFKPMFKLWMAANHKPVIKGRDHAIWRRIRLIPFRVTFADEREDKQLSDKLMTELPGILNWAGGGCLLWQLNGLNPPEEVRTATNIYKGEMDSVNVFLRECCGMGGGEIGAGNLYKIYREWAGKGAVSQRRFGETLVELGIERRILDGRVLYRVSLLTGEGD